MKQRFSSLDVKVISHELSEALVSLRLANIYDLNSKTILLKFAKPEIRKQLVVESGFRCHLTEFARTSASVPGHFVARLRKFLKTRRVTAVSQIGTDRIVDFQFSDGTYHLFLEFFASGNIILTDGDLKILTLLRNVPESEEQEPQRVGLSYRLDNKQNVDGLPALTKERVRQALESHVQKSASNGASTKKTKKKGADELKRGLSAIISEIPPVLLDHAFRLTAFDSLVKPADVLGSDELLESLHRAVAEARNIFEKSTSSATCTGYIFARKGQSTTSEGVLGSVSKPDEGFLYDDFQPFLPKHLEDDSSLRIITYDGFNKTVDEFFSSLEGQKLESRLSEREAAARRRLDAARRDQQKRVEGLQEVQTVNSRKAAAIEANVERVQEAMDAVNGLLEQGMDWVDINKLVEREKRLQNPVAQIIKLPMKLEENLITLELGEQEDEADEDANFDYETDEEFVDDENQPDKTKMSQERLQVDVRLDLTPWANAGLYFDQKKVAADKAQKTVQQSSLALKNAELKIERDLKAGLKQEKPILQPLRKQMWFEKFLWFVSSDGYLVLGGRDSTQNEMLYKRHLRKGDLYVHADLDGAASVIIKNDPKTPDAPVPPATLAQACSLTVCSSSAWDSKAAMSAWWVKADQVSKSAPTGDFLNTGSFVVRDKKNFMPPTQLMLGFGLLFKVSEESKRRHVKHRLHDSDSVDSRLDVSVPASAATANTAGEGVEVTANENSHSCNDDGGDDHASETTALADGTLGVKADPNSDDEDQDERANPLQPVAAGGSDDVKYDHTRDVPEVLSKRLSTPGLEGDQDDTDRLELKGSGVGEMPGSDHEEVAETGRNSASASTLVPGASSVPGTQKKGPAKRGQRGKAKRNAKYKDQDDEDRALMEALVGVAAGRQKAEAEAKAKAEREAQAAAAQQRRLMQQKRKAQEIAEHERMRQKMLEEGIEMLEGSEAADVTAFDALVGTPLPGDEILEAIPVCAPWNAMARLKYKVKLQPGSQKKGKAVKEIVERWKLAAGRKGVLDEAAVDTEKMWPREVELIKALKVEEAMNCVPVGKLTVMAAGGALSAGGGGGGSSKGGSGAKGGGRGARGPKRK